MGATRANANYIVKSFPQIFWYLYHYIALPITVSFCSRGAHHQSTFVDERQFIPLGVGKAYLVFGSVVSVADMTVIGDGSWAVVTKTKVLEDTAEAACDMSVSGMKT